MRRADLGELIRRPELEAEVAREKGINAETLRRVVARVEEYSESQRPHGLPDDLLSRVTWKTRRRGEEATSRLT